MKMPNKTTPKTTLASLGSLINPKIYWIENNKISNQIGTNAILKIDLYFIIELCLNIRKINGFNKILRKFNS